MISSPFPNSSRPHAIAEANPAHVMQCMEIWGGNDAVDRGVILAGLDAWVLSRPYADAANGGGDVHYVSSCATGRITRLLVADVSGHGADVAETARGLRSLMRRYVNYIDQTRFVREMNGQFRAMAQTGRFATALVTTYFGPTGELSICNAGHPPPLLYRARNREWSVLAQAPAAFVRAAKQPERAPATQRGGESDGPANIPLGILDMSRYEQFTLRLATGDMVLCYTDSLIEAKNAAGELLGRQGLLDIVRTLDVSPPDRLIPRLLTAVAALAEGNLATDDATALLFRPNGGAPRAPFFQRALAPLRVAAASLAALRPGADRAPLPELSLPNLGGAIFGPLSRLRRASRQRSE